MDNKGIFWWQLGQKHLQYTEIVCRENIGFGSLSSKGLVKNSFLAMLSPK
jgi:hypothetical protein